VGTGQGGADQIKGEVIDALLVELYKLAEATELDIVLMTYSAPALAASQSRRKQLVLEDRAVASTAWSELNEPQRDQAHTLARHAEHGNLVLFLGAGVGVGAGLPNWNDLLSKLAEMNTDEQKALAHLPAIDRARIIQGRMFALGQHMGETIARRLATDRCSLTHALLAALPIHKSATMNYDTI
jgi:hypothetical protein